MAKPEEKFDMLVHNTSYKNFNLFPILLIPYAFAYLSINAKILFYPCLAVAIILTIFAIKFQIEYIKNLKAWDYAVPKEGELIVKRSEGKIFTDGYEISIDDISLVKINLLDSPKQSGISQGVLNMTFVNAMMIFELKDGRTIKVSIQSKKDMKRLIEIFSEMNIKSSFDMMVYKLCGIR